MRGSRLSSTNGLLLHAGDLRHMITIRREVNTPDGSGFTSSWQDYAQIWAEVRAMDGREAVVEHSLQGISVYRIRVRWRNDLLTSDQIELEGGTTLNITSIADPDGLRTQLMIMATTESVQS